MNRAHALPGACRVPGFLSQFPLCSRERRFVRVDLACREFQHDPPYRKAKLTLEHEPAIRENRYDQHGAREHDIFARGLTVVRQAEAVAAQLEQGTGEHVPTS